MSHPIHALFNKFFPSAFRATTNPQGTVMTTPVSNTYTFDTTDVDAAGKKVASYQATLMLAGMPAGPGVPVTPGTPFTLTGTLPGTYHVEVAALDADGALLATPAASATFVVDADTMAIPFTVTVVPPAAVAVPATVTLQTPAA